MEPCTGRCQQLEALLRDVQYTLGWLNMLGGLGNVKHAKIGKHIAQIDAALAEPLPSESGERFLGENDYRERIEQLEALLRRHLIHLNWCNAHYVERVGKDALADDTRAALAEPAPIKFSVSEIQNNSFDTTAPEETPSDAIRIAQETVNSADGTSGMKILAREVLRKAHPAVTPQEWRELGRLEGVAKCAKVALAYIRAPGPDWTKMAPEWETKPEMYKIGYAYASGCSEQADDIYERIIALKDVSEYVNAREPDPFLIEVCDELFGSFLHQRSSLDDDFKYQCAHCERGMHVQNWWLAEHEPDCIINRVREFLVKHKPESVPEAHKYGSVSQDGQPK